MLYYVQLIVWYSEIFSSAEIAECLVVSFLLVDLHTYYEKFIIIDHNVGFGVSSKATWFHEQAFFYLLFFQVGEYLAVAELLLEHCCSAMLLDKCFLVDRYAHHRTLSLIAADSTDSNFALASLAIDISSNVRHCLQVENALLVLHAGNWTEILAVKSNGWIICWFRFERTNSLFFGTWYGWWW